MAKVPAINRECKDCKGDVRAVGKSFFHVEPRGYPQLQTIARNVGKKSGGKDGKK